MPPRTSSTRAPLDGRRAAFDRLSRIEAGAYAARLGAGDTDPREERQAADLVGGVTRLRRRLDYIIDALYSGQRPLEPAVRQVLRIGLYELTAAHTPVHAAVSEAVELAKQVVPRAKGLVNGLLRTAARRLDAGTVPLPEGDDATALAVRFSYPDWLVERWLARYGTADTKALMELGNERPHFALRPNLLREDLEAFTARLDALGVAWEPSPYLDDAVRVARLQPVIRAGWLERGDAAVQDEAAALVVRLLDPQPGETVADVCAAPGTKATYAALRMRDQGRVLASDLHPRRARLVDKSARALGLESVSVRAADARELAREGVQADRVLLDAPCSGLGVLAKRADLRWQRSPEDFPQLLALQDELLDAAAALVRPGGLLVYSTCTTEPAENEERVAAFLARQPAFKRERATGLVPDAMLTPTGDYQALPHRHGTDGAYGARLRRSPA